MATSASTIPHAWLLMEVDATNLVHWRASEQRAFQSEHGFELTYLPLVAKAVIEALCEHPAANSRWAGDRLLQQSSVHLSIAVASEHGLMVPVIHSAESLGVTDLASAIRSVVQKARAGRLDVNDIQGGTFTLNNTGALGSIASQPIINHPQAAILNMEAIVRRPVVVNEDAIAVRSMMNLCLSFRSPGNGRATGGRISPGHQAKNRIIGTRETARVSRTTTTNGRQQVRVREGGQVQMMTLAEWRKQQAASRPDWIKVRISNGKNYRDLRGIMRGLSLHTVCEEAQCPNIGECWENRTATFMILGKVCTRACRFCAVITGRPNGLDTEEPERVAEAVDQMGLRHVVVTSVARDDLPDGGAGIFAETIRAIRRRENVAKVEVLIPDFAGSDDALRKVMEAGPDVLNHNLETVERLQSKVRAKARYARSLRVLERAKELAPGGIVKSGIMLGVGEEWDEIVATMNDLRGVGCDVMTIGQYMRPSPSHLPIARYYQPAEFDQLRDIGMSMGFRHVESGPLVRSSYHAHKHV